MRCIPRRPSLFALLLVGCGDPPPVIEPPPNKHELALELPPPEPVPEPAPPAPEDYLNPPPDGFVDLRGHVPGIRTEVRYHTANNFTEAPLPGYGAPGAWLLKEPADALAKVQADLAKEGLGLLVYDAYRPRRGTLGMVAWAERTDQVFLLDNGYIARLSGHNRGNTIDLTLADLRTGEPLDMGTPWDTLSEASHTKNAEGEALDNRLKLKTAMEAHGFGYYYKEWWHFSYKMDPRPTHRDVPYGCFEPDEGAWSGPSGWNEPGFEMPKEVALEACPDLVDPLPAKIEALRTEFAARAEVRAMPVSTATGGLSIEQVEAVLRANPQIGEGCVNQRPFHAARVGQLVIAIAADGTVTEAHSEAKPCLDEPVRGLEFPASSEPTVVRWVLEY